MKLPFQIPLSALFLAVVACTDYREEEMPVSFGVDVSQVDFSSATSSRSVTVTSGTMWDVSSMPEWISLKSIKSSVQSPYEWIVDFNAVANDEYDREGLIIIKSGSEAEEIVVTQEGKKGKYIAVESVSLSSAELNLTVGESAALAHTISPGNASVKEVSWKSSASSVATISQTGRVDAVAEGTALITVTTEDGNKTATCRVTVKPVSVSSVSLDRENLSLKIGETSTLVATVLPDNAANKKVSWSSSNTGVATVDSNGKVTAIGIGSARITITTDDGGKTATCSVSVSPIAVTGVNLNKTSLTLTIGGTDRLTATVAPSNATNKNVMWSSSNTSIATVDSNGNVSAVKVGTAVITVKTEDGGKTATCAVTVNPISVTGVSLNQTSLTMTEGDTQTLTATITPSNATDKSVTWSSNNTSVATVSSSGVVTAKAAGSATITVTTVDGGKAATCSVTVHAKIVAVTGVSLDKTTLSITVGETLTLTATITPSNATNKALTWSSSNTSIATVSSSGVVTAKSAGNAVITVTTNDGEKTATCAITVKASMPSVPEAIDLGLSVKWASFNIGATKPEEYGDYYAWGETRSKDNYSWGTYKWCTGSRYTMTKYCDNSGYGSNGFTDNKIVLDSEDDAAIVSLGGKWRMPTDAEWTEIRENCIWTWTTQNGVNGYLVSASNGNSIFLPAAGSRYGTYLSSDVGSRGYYWSSSLYTGYPDYAWSVDFRSGYVYGYDYNRYGGFSVRPVYVERTTTPGGDIEGTEKDPWN